MKTVNDLHPKAMDLAEEAFRLREKNQHKRALELFVKALELEREAALLLPPIEESEPSRSILFRSAASLAFNGENYEEAERLVAHGLSGYPPIEIKEELKNLYEDINFQRHLYASGVSLSENQWLMSIHGNATYFGGTLVEPLFNRIEKVTALFYRTVERMLGVDYRIHGSSKKEIKDVYGLYLNAFAPSSFAVSFQVGAPNPQLEFFDHRPKPPVKPDKVVDELMSCLELWELGKSDTLKERIPNQTYYENFVGIAKQIAPDGDDVKLVGFKSVRKGREKPVTLRKSRERLREQPYEVLTLKKKGAQKINFKGILKFASTPITRHYGTVQLLTEKEGQQSIKVPLGMMKEVVKPYYEESVIIGTMKKGDLYYLTDIQNDPDA